MEDRASTELGIALAVLEDPVFINCSVSWCIQVATALGPP